MWDEGEGVDGYDVAAECQEAVVYVLPGLQYPKMDIRGPMPHPDSACQASQIYYWHFILIYSLYLLIYPIYIVLGLIFIII